MAKVSAIAPLGHSPPVITEFVQYVYQGLQMPLTDLTILATQDEFVKAGVELVREALKDRYPKVHLHGVWLESEDLSTQEATYDFMRTAVKVLREEKVSHRPDALYLCIAGGRKEASVILAMLGQLFGVDAIFHVVVSDIKTYSVELERARAYIEELAKAEDKSAYYAAHREIFDKLMYPPPSAYAIIKIPIIPYPYEVLVRLVRLLSGHPSIRKADAKVPQSLLEAMRRAGLVQMAWQKVYVTDDGRMVGSILKEVV